MAPGRRPSPSAVSRMNGFTTVSTSTPTTSRRTNSGDWNDAFTVLRAAQLAAERRDACLHEGRSLAFETVFSAADKPEFVRQALSLGYFVRIFFVGTERPEINAARVARRVLQVRRLAARVTRPYLPGDGDTRFHSCQLRVAVCGGCGHADRVRGQSRVRWRARRCESRDQPRRGRRGRRGRR